MKSVIEATPRVTPGHSTNHLGAKSTSSRNATPRAKSSSSIQIQKNNSNSQKNSLQSVKSASSSLRGSVVKENQENGQVEVLGKILHFHFLISNF